MPLTSVLGGYELSAEDQRTSNTQKSITNKINQDFIQVGACWLKPSAKDPIDKSWFSTKVRDVNLQTWIDDPEHQRLNVGFNLQQGWTDIDIDTSDVCDPDYLRDIGAGLRAAGVDTRFAFGRRSNGVPSHYFVQLPEDEAPNFEYLRRFEPRPIMSRGTRYHTQLRSYPTDTKNANIERTAKQTVAPGSAYSRKYGSGPEYDLSVWFGREGEARSISDVANTTARRTEFRSIVRGVAFGTVLHVLRPHWVQGNRQQLAVRFTGWLARVVAASAAMNEQEVIANDVFCPVATDAEAEALLHFVVEALGDDEPAMRVRAYRDAREKLERNPDAKIPGWHSITEAVGAEGVAALRAVLTPGSDVTKLTEMAERYVYDETDDLYIDRTRHGRYERYAHPAMELERRHKGDTVFVGGKPRAAFGLFEASNLRARVGTRDMYPELSPGGIYRVDVYGKSVPDEYEGLASTVFNTWSGWPIEPAARVDEALQAKCVAYMDTLFGYLTRDNPDQILWLKKWIAWNFQHPGIKQQVAPVIIGEQGIGKSFFGNEFMKALLTERLWGTASPNIIDQKFNVGPFLNKIFVFIDEARFKTDTVVDEVKKLIRNVSVAGMEKFGEGRTYKVYSRVCFAANQFNIHVGDRDKRDRALFYIRTYDAAHRRCSQSEFEAWARGLKPWFDEFAQLLADPDAVKQYLRYFMDLPVTKKEIEDVSLSSNNDAAVVESNISPIRRILRGIVESGWIHDSGADWSVPFDRKSFAARVQAEARQLGFRFDVNVSAAFDEFKSLVPFDHVSEEYRGGRVNRLRTARRWGDCLEGFKRQTGLEVHPYREPDADDFGVNEQKSTPPKERRGASPDLHAKF